MTAEQKPSVGRIVHYVAHGTPVLPGGEQAFPSACRAAIVTEVVGQSTVGLAVLNPSGMFFNQSEYHDGAKTPGLAGCHQAISHGRPHRYCSCGWIEASYKGGTWHWPERVE